MSEIENTTPTTETPKPKKARKPRNAAFTKPTTVADVARAIAKAKGTDPNVEAKRLRGRIRANFDDLKKSWPALKAQGKVNRDGNRYPPMPAKVANDLVKGKVKA